MQHSRALLEAPVIRVLPSEVSMGVPSRCDLACSGRGLGAAGFGPLWVSGFRPPMLFGDRGVNDPRRHGRGESSVQRESGRSCNLSWSSWAEVTKEAKRSQPHQLRKALISYQYQTGCDHARALAEGASGALSISGAVAARPALAASARLGAKTGLCSGGTAALLQRHAWEASGARSSRPGLFGFVAAQSECATCVRSHAVSRPTLSPQSATQHSGRHAAFREVEGAASIQHPSVLECVEILSLRVGCATSCPCAPAGRGRGPPRGAAWEPCAPRSRATRLRARVVFGAKQTLANLPSYRSLQTCWC